MGTEIRTVESKHSRELLTATEKVLAAHNLRLKPGVTVDAVIDGLAEQQVTLAQSHGYAVATMKSSLGADQPVHVSDVIEAFAEKKPDQFFPRTSDGITSRDQMDRQAKIKMLSEEGGLERFSKLPATRTEQVVVLDHTRLNRKQWLSLDRTTRAELCGKWDTEVIGQIMGRK